MFSERLKQLREELNISQTQLANDLNLSRSTISSYELNKRQPDFAILGKLADYFNVSIDYLLGRNTFKTFSENIPVEDIQEFFQLLKNTNTNIQFMARNIAFDVILVLNDLIKDNNEELLSIFYNLYDSLSNFHLSLKYNETSMFENEIIDTTLTNLTLSEKLKVLSICKNQCNSAMDELLQYYIRKEESNE